MGDTWALTIGLLLSVMSIRICDTPDEVLSVNPAVVAFALLLILCCDVVRVYIYRIKAYRNPFLPDKTFIHHKRLVLGISQHIAMPTIVLSSVVLTLMNYELSTYLDITLLFALDLAIGTLSNIALSRLINNQAQHIV